MAYLNGEEILFNAQVRVNGGGAEIVNTLENNETDKAPSVAAVNEGLAGKLDKVTHPKDGKSYVYALNYDGTNKVFQTSLNATAGNIAMYGATSNTGKSVCKGTIGVAEPVEPYQAANKMYVDEKVDAITSQLGGFIGTKTVYGDRAEGGFPVPDNAYPTVYLSDPTFAAINADGESVYTGRATKLIFKNGNDVLGTEDITDYTNPSCFVTLPEGTNTIALNIEELTEGIWDGTTLHYWGYALFQVEGGGAADSNIEAALDTIIDIQNSLIGGDSE